MTPAEIIETVSIAAMIDFACWTQENKFFYEKERDKWRRTIYSNYTVLPVDFEFFTHEEIIEKYFKSIVKNDRNRSNS